MPADFLRQHGRPGELRPGQSGDGSVSGLQCWRCVDPDCLSETAAGQLRRELVETILANERQWMAAASGDAAMAVRVALLTAAGSDRPASPIDLAGCALLLCAAEGDSAARLVLAHLRHRFALGAPSAPAWRA